MKDLFKKIQLLTIVVAGVSLFLPLVSISSKGFSESITYFDGDDGKLILGLLVVVIIIACFQMRKNNLALKITSILFVIAAAAVFFYDMSHMSQLKTLASIYSAQVKYAVGYYIYLIGIIMSVILGALDFINSNQQYGQSYPQMNNNYRMPQMNNGFGNPNNMNNGQMNNNFNNMNNNYDSNNNNINN